MSDAVASQTLAQDKHYAWMKFTNVGDGTGESAVKKVDVSALSPACSGVIIRQIWWNVACCRVQLLWDATTDVVILTLGGGALDGETEAAGSSTSGHWDFRGFPKGGLHSNAGAAPTGDVMLTCDQMVAAMDNHYTIILELGKVNPE